MQYIAFFAAIGAAGFILWNLVGFVFATGRRRKKLKLAGVGCILLLAACIGLLSAADENARRAGYEDLTDKSEAENAGISDPAVWKVLREEQKKKRVSDQVKADEAAAVERIAAAAIAKQDAGSKEAERLAAQKKADEAAEAERVAVQSLAKWDYEWTDSWSEPKLERYRWKDKRKGIVTYIGTKIKFQNGFGAWKHMTYFCDFDPVAKIVVSASALQNAPESSNGAGRSIGALILRE